MRSNRLGHGVDVVSADFRRFLHDEALKTTHGIIGELKIGTLQ